MQDSDSALPVYLIYDREDERFVRPCVDSHALNHVRFYDTIALRNRALVGPAERHVSHLIEHRVEMAGVAVVVSSRASTRSRVIDWEIAAALQARNALIVVSAPLVDPTISVDRQCPKRALANVRSGFALRIRWDQFEDDVAFEHALDEALQRDARRMLNDLPYERSDQPLSLGERFHRWRNR